MSSFIKSSGQVLEQSKCYISMHCAYYYYHSQSLLLVFGGPTRKMKSDHGMWLALLTPALSAEDTF